MRGIISISIHIAYTSDHSVRETLCFEFKTLLPLSLFPAPIKSHSLKKTKIIYKFKYFMKNGFKFVQIQPTESAKKRRGLQVDECGRESACC